MAQTQTSFRGATAENKTERLSTQEDSLAGISFLPKSKLERIHAVKKLSPKSIKKKVNTFLEEQVLPSKEATNYLFDELCKKKDAQPIIFHLFYSILAQNDHLFLQNFDKNYSHVELKKEVLLQRPYIFEVSHFKFKFTNN